MRVVAGRMRRKRGRWLKGLQPLVDLWVGGPGADGRGLDWVNGGYDPAPGLQIVSPSGSTPSSSARFLIRDAGGGWRDKRPGVLAGIGGRVWTGGGWSYNGAKEVTFLGPLPALSTHGITDTVRRYGNATGLTVQDAPGGIVQPYSQRCDVAEGQSAGGWACWPAETVTSVVNGDQVYWHGIVETTTPESFVPMFGAYSNGFFDGALVFQHPLSVESGGTSGQFAWQVKHRGIGPNGGLLVEYWVSQRFTQAVSNVELFAYLLRAGGTPSARTLFIHQHAGHHLKSVEASIYGLPTAMLVANGAQASLIKEDIVFGGGQTDVTLFARVDLRNYRNDASGYRVFAYVANSTYTPLQLAGSMYGLYPKYPDGSAPAYGQVNADVLTLAVSIDGDRLCRGYLNGVAGGQYTIQAPANASPGYRIGREYSSDARTLLAPYRRVLVIPRVLGAGDVARVHGEIVRAEGAL